MTRKAIVSNLSSSLRKSIQVSEDNEAVKNEHRETLHGLINTYTDHVAQGKVEGIRNAKDLIDVMKMDLLLMGEASERTEQMDQAEETRMTRLTSMIDEDDPMVKDIMDDLLQGLNDMNDMSDVMNTGKDVENVDEEENNEEEE